MRGFAPSSAAEVRAKTVKTSANPPFVIQIFEPLKDMEPVAARLGPRLDGRRVATGARLGQREGRDHLARREARQVARLELGRPEEQQALHTDRLVRRDGDRHARVEPGQLLQHAGVPRCCVRAPRRRAPAERACRRGPSSFRPAQHLVGDGAAPGRSLGRVDRAAWKKRRTPSSSGVPGVDLLAAGSGQGKMRLSSMTPKKRLFMNDGSRMAGDSRRVDDECGTFFAQGAGRDALTLRAGEVASQEVSKGAAHRYGCQRRVGARESKRSTGRSSARGATRGARPDGRLQRDAGLFQRRRQATSRPWRRRARASTLCWRRGRRRRRHRRRVDASGAPPGAAGQSKSRASSRSSATPPGGGASRSTRRARGRARLPRGGRMRRERRLVPARRGPGARRGRERRGARPHALPRHARSDARLQRIPGRRLRRHRPRRVFGVGSCGRAGRSLRRGPRRARDGPRPRIREERAAEPRPARAPAGNRVARRRAGRHRREPQVVPRGGRPGARRPTDRLGGSIAAAMHAVREGASIVRVHDVRATRQAIDLARRLDGRTARRR